MRNLFELSERQWIGGTFVTTEDTWRWQDGDLVDFGIPDDYVLSNGSTELYLAVDSNGHWVDDINKLFFFVCEIQESKQYSILNT